MSAHQTTAPLIQAKSRPPLVGVTWTLEAVAAIYNLPFNEIMFRAQETHRQYFPEGDVELATLLSIKTGGCPEDCG